MSLESSARISRVQARVRGYASRGNYRGAETCLLAELRSAKIQPADRIFLWNELGMIYKYLGKFRESRQRYRRALRKAHGCLEAAARNFFLADLYHNLGGLEHAQSHFRRGEKLARKGLRLRRRVASEESLPVAVDLAGLAALLEGQKKFAGAEKLYRRALCIYRREYGPTHGETAILLSNLAALYQSTQRFGAARSCYRRALKIKRRTFGAAHPSVAVTLNNLGMLHYAQGNARGAERYLGEALRILLRSVGRRHFQYCSVARNYETAVRAAYSSPPASLPGKSPEIGKVRPSTNFGD